jgi:hypothetical protein
MNGNFRDFAVPLALSAVPSVHPINDDRESKVSIASPSMHVTARSYLTAGIAALGVGALALAPVQPIPTQIALAPERVISTLAVELAATIDPIPLPPVDPVELWVDTFETAGANIGTLLEFYLQKPFPILQTIGANIGTYFAELGSGQGDLIPGQIAGNIQTFFQAPWSPGVQSELDPVGPAPGTIVKVPLDPDTFTASYISGTTPASGASPEDLYGGLLLIAVGQAAAPACAVDGNCLISQLAPLLNFLATPYSGQLIGLLGPLLAPVVALTRSFTAVGEYFQAGEVMSAITELINIPANITNAVLNGAGFLDLTEIVNSIAPLPVPGAKIGLNVGGLLNSVPVDGSLVPDSPTPPTKYASGIGLDSLAASVPSLLEAPGLPNGWGGSVIGLGQFLGEQLLVTPPPPPPVAAEPAAAVQAATADVAPAALPEAPAEDAAPAVVDVPAPVEAAPAVAEVEESAPVLDVAELEAAVEATEATAPAVENSAPEAAATGDQSDDDAGRGGDSNRRG